MSVYMPSFLCRLDFVPMPSNSYKGVTVWPRFHGQFFLGLSCKFNSVAKFNCQISVTKVSEPSNLSNICCV